MTRTDVVFLSSVMFVTLLAWGVSLSRKEKERFHQQCAEILTVAHTAADSLTIYHAMPECLQ